MTWEVAFVCLLLVAALASFIAEKFPTDQVALTVLAILVGASALPFENSLPTLDSLLTVFANPAPMTIAAMFILSAALDKTGLLENLSSALRRLTRLGYRRFLLVLVIFVAGISAFINNTPVVMVFMPVVLGLSRSLNMPASKLLIPLSYASIFGGTCTLVGTSTNILASSIMEAAGEPPLGMFEIGWIGLPLVFLGMIYLALFADRLLPERDTLTSILSEEERKEFISDAYVQKGAVMVGKKLTETRLWKESSVRVLEIIRNNVPIKLDQPSSIELHEGDRLVLALRPSGFVQARNLEGLALAVTDQVGVETISAHEGAIVEGVIGPNSAIVGQSVRELNFRQRFRVILLAIHRRGINLSESLETTPLEAGDLLLMMGTDEAIEALRRSDEIFLLDHPPVPARGQRRRQPLVLATVIGVIAAAGFGIMPIVAAALVGAAVIFLTGCLRTKEGYASIEWSILVLIYGMLGLGLAMQSTGTAALIAQGLYGLTDFAFFSAEMRPYILLAAIYLTTMVMTETLSNNATVVLMAPIALSLGATLGVEPRPFIIACCVASSASFSTPVGYQTNTYVYGVGGYKFTDFARIGLPLNLLYFVVSIFAIPLIWKF